MPKGIYKRTRKGNKNISLSLIGKNQGELNGSWTGGTEYYSLHKWINKQKGKPRYCEICKRTDRKQYDWANIDHAYSRKLNEWIRLCRSCHIKYDKNL